MLDLQFGSTNYAGNALRDIRPLRNARSLEPQAPSRARESEKETPTMTNRSPGNAAPARVHIRGLSVWVDAATSRSLLPPSAPWTARPLVPEDLGTRADKGRTDLVRVTDRSGAMKMTRTLAAEVHVVRKAV